MVLLQILTEFIELLAYPTIQFLLPWIPSYLYAFYTMAIKRRYSWTKTDKILSIILFIFGLTASLPLSILISSILGEGCPVRPEPELITPIDFPFVLVILVLFILYILASALWWRQRVASFSEVLAVTLASLLIAGVTATLLLLDLYARPPLLQLTVRLVQLATLSYFTALVVSAARKKALGYKKPTLILLAIGSFTLILPYYWNIAHVIVITLIALLPAVAVIRGPDPLQP